MAATPEEIYSAAHKAGLRALWGMTPTPMIVFERANPLDENSEIVEAECVPEGLCGFAWVVIRPASSDFARWLLKNNLARRHEGGAMIWIYEGVQSVERKEAYAKAFAEVVHANGVDAYTGSRLD